MTFCRAWDYAEEGDKPEGFDDIRFKPAAADAKSNKKQKEGKSGASQQVQCIQCGRTSQYILHKAASTVTLSAQGSVDMARL